MADAVVVAALAVLIALLLVIAAFVRYMFKRKRSTGSATAARPDDRDLPCGAPRSQPRSVAAFRPET